MQVKVNGRTYLFDLVEWSNGWIGWAIDSDGREAAKVSGSDRPSVHASLRRELESAS